MRLYLERLVFPGRHQPVFAAHGVVATSQPLATQAGLAALRRGGNAVDAALAAAIALTVVEPASNSPGGDAFALVWDGGQLHGLNGSGRAPAALTMDALRENNGGTLPDEMPERGWGAVTVPGAPAAWRDLSQRFGRLPFADLFADAIDYAENGFPIAPIALWGLRYALETDHAALSGEEFAELPRAFAPDGRLPQVGDICRSAELASSLRQIAETNASAFYQGALAQRIVDFAAQTGGYLTADDLTRHTSEWVTPIHTNYRGYDVWEIPPNTQGIAVLLALNILEGYDLNALPRDSVESFHLQLEAMKLAFADVERYVADPTFARLPIEGLLAKSYAAERRALIGDEAIIPEAGAPADSDTTYLCAADADGMMVSLIQSTYGSFGSHIVAPETGIALQNRGSGFSLDPNHLNRLEPGKRPFHTIIPGFLTRDGQAVGPFGVMGGHMQPQGHVQMVVNTVDYAMDPQTSLDAPRWSWWGERSIKLEPSAAALAEPLAERGHEVEIDPEVDWAGRGQIIWRLANGAYIAGSESRADGQAAGY